MVEITDTAKFNMEATSQVATAVKNVVSDSKIDEKWVQLATIGDSILKNIVTLVQSKKELSQNNNQNQGVTNPNTSNVQPQQTRQPDVEVNFKIYPMFQELKAMLKAQTFVSPNITLAEFLADEGYEQLIQTEMLQNPIRAFLKKNSEVMIK